MKIYVTGADGAIGSNLVPLLREKGHEVIEIMADVRDAGTFYAELISNGAEKGDWLIHLAATVNTVACDVAGYHAVNTNVTGAFNAATHAHSIGMSYCYFSTTAIYEPNIPITEGAKKDPQTLYGMTKYLGERLAWFVFKDRLEDLLVVRPCFAFGGENDHSVATNLVKNYYENKPMVVLLDPENKKDYMSVRNLCEAVEMLIDARYSGDFNISYGEPIKFGELVNLLHAKGISPKIDYRAEKDYMGHHVVDNTKIKSIGWEPTVSLSEGLDIVIKKYRDAHTTGN